MQLRNICIVLSVCLFTPERLPHTHRACPPKTRYIYTVMSVCVSVCVCVGVCQCVSAVCVDARLFLYGQRVC